MQQHFILPLCSGLMLQQCKRTQEMHRSVCTHHNASVELVEALHGAITETVTQLLLHKVRVVEDIVCHQRLLQNKRISFQSFLANHTGKEENSYKYLNMYALILIPGTQTRLHRVNSSIRAAVCEGYLVCDVLLFCWSVTFRVNQGGVGHQVASVLHNKTPTHTVRETQHLTVKRRRDRYDVIKVDLVQ